MTLLVAAAGWLYHSILRRVLSAVGVRQFDIKILQEASKDNDNVAWRVYQNKKERQAVSFVCTEDPSSEKAVLAALVASEPSDLLNARVQHLDAIGGSLKECALDSGPVLYCLSHCWRLVHRPLEPEGSRTRLAWSVLDIHLQEQSEGYKRQVVEDVVSSSVAIACQVDNRFWKAVRDEYPLCIMRAANEQVHIDERRDTMEKLYADPRCCHDEFWSEPFLEAVPSQQVFRKKRIQSLLKRKNRDVKLMNMYMEGKLAHIKCSVPKIKGAPLIERLVYVPTLGLLLERHVEACGRALLQSISSRICGGGWRRECVCVRPCFFVLSFC